MVVAPPQLKVFVAGRLALENGTVAIDEDRFLGRQGRVLFAYLVVEHGRPVPREKLSEALWGETPPLTSDKALAVVVSKLRGLLAEQGLDGAHALTGAFGCYRLELPEGTWIDAVAASKAVEEAERALAAGDLDASKAAAASAESLLREPFLPGEDAEWVEEKRREYAELHTRAVTVLADACLRSGQTAQAVRWAEQAVALAPFREGGYRRLMEAHVAAGNRAEALQVYEQCRRLLADELGAYPSPETESIYRELLAEPIAPTAAPEQSLAAAPPAAPKRRRNAQLLAGVVAAALLAAGATVLATRGGGVAVRPESLVKIDTRTGKVVDDVRVGRSPGGAQIVGRWIFVTSQIDGTLYRIDRATDAVTSSGRFSTGSSIARQNAAQLWIPSPSQSVMRLVHATSLEHYPLDDIPLSQVFPSRGISLAAVSGGRSVWVADRGSVTVSRWRIRPFAHPRLVHSYPLTDNDWPLGAAFGAGAVWFGLGDPSNAVLRIDAVTGTARRISVGDWPTQPAFGFGSVWVPMFWDNTVWRLDPVTGRPQAIVQVGRRPWSLAVTRRGIWVTDHCDGTVKRIDPSTNTVVQTLHIGQHPQWIAAAGGFLWVGVAGKEYKSAMSCGALSTA